MALCGGPAVLQCRAGLTCPRLAKAERFWRPERIGALLIEAGLLVFRVTK